MRNGTLSQKGVRSLGSENKVLVDVANKEHQVKRVEERVMSRGAEKSKL